MGLLLPARGGDIPPRGYPKAGASHSMSCLEPRLTPAQLAETRLYPAAARVPCPETQSTEEPASHQHQTPTLGGGVAHSTRLQPAPPSSSRPVYVQPTRGSGGLFCYLRTLRALGKRQRTPGLCFKSTLAAHTETGQVLRETDSGLKTTFSNGDCAKQLQERNTSGDGKMFPLVLLGWLPSESPAAGRGARRDPPRRLHNGLGQEVDVYGVLVQSSSRPPAAKPGAPRVG